MESRSQGAPSVVSVTYIIVLLALMQPPTTVQGKLFQLLDELTSEPCLMVDLTFTLNLTAVQDGQVVASDQLNSQDHNIEVSGGCGNISALIALVFPNGVSWSFKFSQDTVGKVSLSPFIQFTPSEVFTSIFVTNTPVTMKDPLISSLGSADSSYSCDHTTTAKYVPVTDIIGDTNFTTTTNIYHIHAQAFNIHGGNFSDAVVCEGNSSTTTVSPTTKTTPTTTNSTVTTPEYTNSTTTAPSPTNSTVTTPEYTNSTTTAPSPTNSTVSTPEYTNSTTTTSTNTTEATTVAPSSSTPTAPTTTTTPGPSPPVVEYIVSDAAGIECIAMDGAFTLIITYPVKDGDTKTARFFIPADAVSTGNCSLSPTTQEVDIKFFDSWHLNFVFSQQQRDQQERWPRLLSSPSSSFFSSAAVSESRPDYRITNITLEFTATQQRFPGTTWRTGSRTKTSKSNYDGPHVSSAQDFYQCESQLDTQLDADVKVESQDFKFKAFNKGKKVDFSGKAAVCNLDAGGSQHRTLVIVGCVLAAFVLLCFIAFVVLRVISRRRRSYRRL